MAANIFPNKFISNIPDGILKNPPLFSFLLFLSGFSFTDTDDSQDSRGRERTFFYSTLPFPPAHEHSDIYLQLCMWDDYHIFLIAPLVFTACICLRDDLILAFFCYSNLRWETSGFELASTITLALQANRLTKCAGHPLPDIISVVVSYHGFFFKLLRQLLRLLLLILMVSPDFYPRALIHSSSMATLLLLMIQDVYQGIHSTALDSWVVGNFISFNELFRKALQLDY